MYSDLYKTTCYETPVCINMPSHCFTWLVMSFMFLLEIDFALMSQI